MSIECSLLDDVAALLLRRRYTLIAAESCTGGMIGAACTRLAGSSTWFQGSIVSYANALKISLLNVPEQVLIDHGAVSQPTVAAMCAGALRYGADVAVAVSGIAGPTGGTLEKPVGTVFIGWQFRDEVADVVEYHFCGSRESVRQQALEHALKGLKQRL